MAPPRAKERFEAQSGGRDVLRVFGEESVRGRVFLITGVSPNSLGGHLALSLAAHSPRLLILASRTLSKIHLVAKHILSLHPTVSLACVQVDFSCLTSIRSAARDVTSVLEEHTGGAGIDVLFNNAGINICERQLTSDTAVEMQFATNHLGPFLFTNLLLPLILRELTTTASSSSVSRPPRKRIINTSSEAHRISPVRFSDINLEPRREVPPEQGPRRNLPEGILRGGGRYEHAVAYGQSKTANVLFAVGLNARVGGQGVESFAINPGTIMTDLVRGLDAAAMEGLMKVPDWKTFDQGIATMLVAALDPALDPANGVYLDDCKQRRAARWATDGGMAERLWSLSEELVGEKFRVKVEEEKRGSKL